MRKKPHVARALETDGQSRSLDRNGQTHGIGTFDISPTKCCALSGVGAGSATEQPDKETRERDSRLRFEGVFRQTRQRENHKE